MKNIINAPEFKMLLLKIDGQIYPGYKVPADPFHVDSHSSCIYWKIMPPNPIPYSEEWIIPIENVEGYRDFPEMTTDINKLKSDAFYLAHHDKIDKIISEFSYAFLRNVKDNDLQETIALCSFINENLLVLVLEKLTSMLTVANNE